jgi:hypothetical protein
METDALDDPRHSGALGIHGGGAETEHRADVIEECGG